MRQILKNILLVVFPRFIKDRVFKHYQLLNWKTLSNSEFDAELLLLEFLLNKNSIFFDIGANKGEYALYAEKHIPVNQIYLFEPEQKLNHQLKHIFPQSHVLPLALSDKKGEFQFKIPLINGVLDNCLSSLEVNRKEDNETEAIIYKVKTDSLDNFVTQQVLNPDLIKIDVEGHELSVLKGAANYIAQHHPTLIIEIEQRHHQNMDIELVFTDFKQQGYQCYYFSKKAMQLLSYEDKTHLTNHISYFGSINYINNYIFIDQSNTSISSIEKINKTILEKAK